MEKEENLPLTTPTEKSRWHQPVKEFFMVTSYCFTKFKWKMLPWKMGILLHQWHQDQSTSSGNLFLCSFFIMELWNYRVPWVGRDPQEPSKPCRGWSCGVVALGLVLPAHSPAEESGGCKESPGDPSPFWAETPQSQRGWFPPRHT